MKVFYTVVSMAFFRIYSVYHNAQNNDNRKMPISRFMGFIIMDLSAQHNLTIVRLINPFSQE